MDSLSSPMVLGTGVLVTALLIAGGGQVLGADQGEDNPPGFLDDGEDRERFFWQGEFESSGDRFQCEVHASSNFTVPSDQDLIIESLWAHGPNFTTPDGHGADVVWGDAFVRFRAGFVPSAQPAVDPVPIRVPADSEVNIRPDSSRSCKSGGVTLDGFLVPSGEGEYGELIPLEFTVPCNKETTEQHLQIPESSSFDPKAIVVMGSGGTDIEFDAIFDFPEGNWSISQSHYQAGYHASNVPAGLSTLDAGSELPITIRKSSDGCGDTGAIGLLATPVS